MKEKVANFFWHGELSLFEYYCIKTFIRKGFEVNVWSFEDLKLPKGCNRQDAQKILSKDKLFSITMNNKSKSLAGFADLFRYHLMYKEGGWWFDSDCICLKEADEFLQLSKNKFVAGWEDKNNINNAVMLMNNITAEQFVFRANEICENKNNILDWGDIGPRMVTSLIKELNLEKFCLSESYFYPIHYRNALLALDPYKTNDVEILCKDSYVYHLWNEVLRKKNINKNVMPPVNSFLHKHFN
jgi:hypothetical protein